VARREIRLQYTGYVIFASKLISVATGLIFQFMLARAIPAGSPDYAIWGNITTVIPYFTIVAGLVPFWVMRCVARRQEGAARTGLAMNSTFAIISATIYLIIIPIILPSLLSGAGVTDPAAYIPFYLLGSIEVIELYLIGIFEPILQSCTPQSVGYGLILQQIIRTVIAYIIIIPLAQPLLGALVSLLIAIVVQLIYYVKLLMPELREQIRWSYVKEWLKGSLLLVYSVIGGQISAYIFIMLFYYGGFQSMEIYYLAFQIAGVITHASALSFALYPMLLTEKRSQHVTDSLKIVLMFAVPMTLGAIVLSSSYLAILRPETIAQFPDASWVLIVLALDSFVVVVSGVYASILTGVENVDQQKLSLKSMVKSKLFLYFTLFYIHSIITLPAAFVILTTFAYQQPVLAAVSVVSLNAIARFAMFIILIFIVRRMIKITVPWKSIAKYTFASAIMATVLFLLPYSERLSTTLLWTAIGGGVYLGVLLLIDKESRLLPKQVFGEIRRKKPVENTSQA
jgi:hypothetical protein